MSNTYVAFLRGINVGGHHKVPMADLRAEMAKLKCENILTILNSGNVIFDTPEKEADALEEKLASHLEKAFGFPIPTIVRSVAVIEDLLKNDPFEGIELTKERRFYISFLQKEVEAEIDLPWESEDGSYLILEKRGKNIISLLDISVTKTPQAMDALEKMYGKGITTRNWNTLKRIEKKIN